jgi:hypothetical protein
MCEIIEMPPRTYTAKLFKIACQSGEFKTAGTLDGYLDLALPDGRGTYQLSLDEARWLVEALAAAIVDVEQNCLYDADPRLQP